MKKSDISRPARLLITANARYLGRHPWQIGLAVTGIALGVAIVVSIQLTRLSALQSFEAATATLSGPSTHRIVGSDNGFDERLFVRLRLDLGLRASAPGLDADIMTVSPLRRRLRLIGIDPIAELELRRGLQGVPTRAPLLLDPQVAVANRRTLSQLGIRTGDRVTISAGGGRSELQIAAMPGANAGAIPDDVLMVDIATAQTLLDAVGRLTFIDLRLDSAAQQDAVAAILPPEVVLVTAGAEQASLEDMTRAFHTNLLALGLLALLVGMFLIYSAQSFLLVQRRELFGGLRAVGVSRAGIVVMIFGEAAALGTAGAFAGVVLGVLLADGLQHLVVRTLNDLYTGVTSGSIRISAVLFGASLLLGAAASAVASIPVALEAWRGRTAAMLRRSVVERTARRVNRRLIVAGAVLGAAGIAVLIPGSSVATGFFGLFLLIFGYALAVPGLGARMTGALERRMRRHAPPLLLEALRSGERNSSRTGIAIAALTIACATGIGIGSMVGSFRQSVDDWLGRLLRADYYVGLPAVDGADDAASGRPAVLQALQAIPDVEWLSTTASVPLRIGDERVPVIVHDLPREAFDGFQFIRGDADGIWRTWRQDTVIVNEPYALRHHVLAGETLSIPTPAGPVAMTIAGVFRDYRTGPGGIAMSAATYRRHFDDLPVDSIGVSVGGEAPSARQRAAIRQALDRALGPGSEAVIRSSHDIRALSLSVFDRTFTITRVLYLLALLIASIGVFANLMALTLERVREFATRRALGLTRGQLRQLILTECAVQGTIAAVLAVPIGLVMTATLIFVINARSFGWTMPMLILPEQIAFGMLLAVAAAWLAGLYPAWRIARRPPAVWLRSE